MHTAENTPKPRSLKLSIWQVRLVYAVIMAICMCVIMSAVTTSLLTEPGTFWDHWPTVLELDLLVAIPAAIALGPLVRRFVKLFNDEII